ncbi:MAG: radical SAM protein [Candidatus Micrarchaeaceae archaeon]
MNQTIELLDLFNSFQGEYPFQGRYSTFIRFLKCNLKCEWCDTLIGNLKPTIYDYDDIVKLTKKSNFITFTGGEPSLYVDEIINILAYLIDTNTYLSNITFETNGVKLEVFEDILKSVQTLGVSAYNICRVIWSPKFYTEKLIDIQFANLYDIFNPSFMYLKLVAVPNELSIVEQFIDLVIQLNGIKVKKNVALMLYTNIDDKSYIKENITNTLKLAEKYGISISTRIQFDLGIK